MQLQNSATLNDIKSDMYFNGKFNSSTFPQNDLNRIINKIYKILQEDIRAVNEDFFLVTTKTDLSLQSVAQGSYTIPTDYEKIKSIWVATLPSNIAAPLVTEYQKAIIIDANSITDASYAFSNPTVVMFGSYFVLYPFFTDVTKYPVTGGVKMYYIPIQSDLVSDTDTPNIFADYHDVISWGSLIETATRLGDEKLFKKATDRFNERRNEMKRDAAQRVLDISPEYIEGQGSAGGWSFPFGKTSI
jgi:hypothetical protein